MAEAYLNLSDFENAEDLYGEVVGLYKEVHGNSAPELATSLFGLGMIERNNTNYETADSFFVEALAVVDDASANSNFIAVAYSE